MMSITTIRASWFDRSGSWLCVRSGEAFIIRCLNKKKKKEIVVMDGEEKVVVYNLKHFKNIIVAVSRG